MPAEDEHRKLAAIMFTDMVGYSALAQRNEALALAEVQRSFFVMWWKVDPELEPLRADLRFTALLKKVGLEP